VAKASKAAGDEAAETVETAVKTGTEAFMAGFEKAVAGYDKLIGFGKETVAAYAKVVEVAGKGAENLHDELYAYSKQTVEDSIANTTKLFASKSIHEAFELQSDIANTAFEAYVTEVSKVSEIVVSTTKETFEPLQGRVQAWVDAVQAAGAA
jgi:phasin family protein